MKPRKQQLDFFGQSCGQIQWQDLPQAQQKEVHSLLCQLFVACLELAVSSGNQNERSEAAQNKVELSEKEAFHAHED